MTLIQPVLILILLCAAAIFLLRMRSKLMDRLIVVAFAVTGTALVVSPQTSTEVAHTLGVGRGVDLVIYLSLLGSGFFLLVGFSKLRELEQQLTQITRQLALLTAEDHGAEHH
ncbi:MAG: DUF2304 domain-containing protein [Bryobacterales bacterium]|nr:DUF2304 domain-containing protein [Bryobacterales bacterium]